MTFKESRCSGLKAWDKEHEQMPDVIEFNYPRVDMTFFREDPRRREIPRLLLKEIAEGAKRLDEQIGRIEQDTMIKYPPTIVLPCALS